MARIVSALNATQLLLTNGFVQEQSAMHRMIDEAQQDVTFLAYGVLKDDITSLHTKYLEDFFAETFTDPARPAESPRAYAAPQRRKIQAYLARAEGSPFDEHRGLAIMVTLHVAYSGYVHGASPHIMEMVDGDPVRFHVRGMRQTTTWQQHADDFLNYVFRSVSAFAIAAIALGHREKFDELRELSERFEETSHD